MDSIDDLLAQVKAEYEAKPNTGKSQTSPVAHGVTPVSNPPSSASVERLLAELGDEYRQHEQAEAKERQRQEEEDRRRQEKLKHLQRQGLRREAEAWLKQLKPLSEEGLWFTEFADGYTSRLEAAIDYLAALKEVQP